MIVSTHTKKVLTQQSNHKTIKVTRQFVDQPSHQVKERKIFSVFHQPSKRSDREKWKISSEKMSGVALILNAICFNSTLCQIPPSVPPVNYVEFYKGELYFGDVKQSQEEKKKQLEKIAREIKDKTITITSIEDYPLSYVERDRDGELVLRGRAMDFFEILMKKYNFKYKLVMPKYNIFGSSNDSSGSVLEMLLQKVSDVLIIELIY